MERIFASGFTRGDEALFDAGLPTDFFTLPRETVRFSSRTRGVDGQYSARRIMGVSPWVGP
jgi:hypothetical protein